MLYFYIIVGANGVVMKKSQLSRNHIITDPIHGVMSFSKDEKELIKQFIDKPIFQRLKRIKQLGCADMVFPGAVHTRFSHSLGACYIGKLVCDQLDINNGDRKIIMGAALLHDIGHSLFLTLLSPFLKGSVREKYHMINNGLLSLLIPLNVT